MPIIDFTEVPEANQGDGKQDTFELFARDLLELVGLRVIEGPSRGADGGRDLVVVETRSGSIGESEIRWLVSCKHFARSGRAVTSDDERDIADRVSVWS